MAFSLVQTASSIINKGVAEVTTGLKDSAAVVGLKLPNLKIPDLTLPEFNLGKDIGAMFTGVKLPSAFSSGAESNSKDGSAIDHKPNPLTQYASYVPLWTLSALTQAQLNDPSLYRDKPTSSTSVVFSSAGRYDKQRISTQFGSPEYYVDDVDIVSLIGPNPKTQNASAHTFKFKVFEPYSMGLFLQSLQAAARNAGFPNYLHSPYLLRLDFQGWDIDGNAYQSPKLSRYFPIKLVNMTFEANEGGSSYQVEAVPFNGAAFGDIINKVYKDINIIGSTAKEALATGENSLVRVLNQQFDQQKKDGLVAVPDQLLIIFPPPQGQAAASEPKSEDNNKATASPGEQSSKPPSGLPTEVGDNAISGSSLGFTLESGGNMSFMKDSDVRDEQGNVVRDKVKIDPTSRTLMFTQGQAISDIITEVILNTEYVRKSAEQLKKNPDGTVSWFRLDAQIKLGDYDILRTDYSKIIIFRVIPYNVHSALFMTPNKSPQGYKELEKSIAKRYEYIFSGKNEDVFRFNLRFNNTFYTAISSSNPKDNKDVVDAAKNSSVSGEQPIRARTPDGDPNAQFAAGGNAPVAAEIDTYGNRIPNASNTNDQRRIIAQDFHNAFINSDTDLISADIDILGDPYYIVDSGMGNYFAQAYDSRFNADGTMDYEGGTVYVHLSLKTVVDVDADEGLYKFQTSDGTGLTTNGGRAKISPFGGIYRIVAVSHMFSGGVFKQRLDILRMKGQANDFDIQPALTGPTGMTEVVAKTTDAANLDTTEPI
jgi:hypothetical protein